MLQMSSKRTQQRTREVCRSHCKSNTHKESLCKKKGERDGAGKFAEEEQKNNNNRLFMAKHTRGERSADSAQMRGIMVDGGATSPNMNNFDDTFQPESNSVEPAD